MLRVFIDGDDNARRGGRKTGNKTGKQCNCSDGTKETRHKAPNAPIYTRTTAVNRLGLETLRYG